MEVGLCGNVPSARAARRAPAMPNAAPVLVVELDGVRAAAIEVFGVLFDQADVLASLEEHIAAMAPLPPPPRKDDHDRLINMVDTCT